ncbi:MAG: GAF domain-containing protein [Chloroflexi bacterium]|nr:GAF domain-containing protein [Chloroflexota bacterium]
MVNPNVKPPVGIGDHEIAAMRHNLNLLKTQVQIGRIDPAFLEKQLDKLNDLLGRMDQEHKLRKQQERFELLYNVSRLLGSSLDLQQVLNQVMDAILQLTGAERGFLVLRDDDGALQVQAARNFDQQTLSSEQFNYSRTIANSVLDTGEPVLTTNASEDPRFSEHESIVGQMLRSIMAMPLRVRGRVMGAIYVDNRAVSGLFDETNLAALEAFAGQAAVAIDNAQLFSATDQKLAERLEELRQLRRIDIQLSENLDVEHVMKSTLDWSCRLSEATYGHIGLVENKRILAVHHAGFSPEDTQPFYLEKLYPMALKAVETGTSVNSYDEKRVQGVLIVPIQRKDKVFAVIVLRRDSSFTQEQMEMIERVVARAAAAIENSRLYSQLQTADRAKSEFVGTVAHELKVPMNIILGYADLVIMDGDLREEQLGYMQRIRDAVKRMEMLVSDLSDISRIESGHFFMNETRVAVEDVVQAVRDNVITQIRARNHAYVEQVKGKMPPLRVDFYRLLQVLTNLVSNAYKYTPDGGVITLTVVQRDKRVEFSVQDTGIGLSEEAIEKLGTKFWRADDDFTRSQPGTGLGFAITSSLVRQMGGEILIESQVGRGSKFTFSVPIAEGNA